MRGRKEGGKGEYWAKEEKSRASLHESHLWGARHKIKREDVGSKLKKQRRGRGGETTEKRGGRGDETISVPKRGRVRLEKT